MVQNGCILLPKMAIKWWICYSIENWSHFFFAIFSRLKIGKMVNEHSSMNTPTTSQDWYLWLDPSYPLMAHEQLLAYIDTTIEWLMESAKQFISRCVPGNRKTRRKAEGWGRGRDVAFVFISLRFLLWQIHICIYTQYRGYVAKDRC